MMSLAPVYKMHPTLSEKKEGCIDGPHRWKFWVMFFSWFQKINFGPCSFFILNDDDDDDDDDADDDDEEELK